MTTPTAPYTPRHGYRIYGYENTASGDNILFSRYASEQSEQQVDAPLLVATPGGTYAVDNDQVPAPQPKSIGLRALAYLDLGAAYVADLLKITAGPGRLWKIDHQGYLYWTPVVRTSFLALRQGKPELLTGGVPVMLEFNAFTGLWYGELVCCGGRYGYPAYGLSVYHGGTGAIRIYLTASPQTAAVPNIGTAAVRALLLRVVAPGGGGVTGPLGVANTTTGHSLTITGNLAAGSNYVLDTTVPSFEEDAADDWVNCTPGANQRGHMQLDPGVNTFTLTHGGIVGPDNYIEFEFYDPYY